MATLYITEFSQIARQDINGVAVQAAQTPPYTEQTVTIGSTTQSAAFQASTRFVRLQPDGICSIAWGLNPVATTANARMTAGQTEYYGVIPGQKVAVITNT